LPGKPRKHVPLRSCIACRERRPKRDLIRIVRTPDGTLKLDPKGKRSGRGAYLCRKHQCLEAALQSRRLSQALKCEVTVDEVAVLKAHAQSFIEESAVESQTTPLAGSNPEGQGSAGSV
jgi:predicted RNA-binding protein YlxR (DUF448 family)